MERIEILQKALALLQANLIEGKPPLLVARDHEEVLGISIMLPTLKGYCVSQEQFERSKMAKTWPGKILFLNGDIDETKKTNHETSDSLCKSDRDKLQVSQKANEESRSPQSQSSLGQHFGRVQEKQIFSKGRKK